MRNYDPNVLEMLGCIHEDLDIDKIEEKFVDLVADVFSFDRIALLFVKHKKEVLQGKLSKGFDQDLIENLEIPLEENSVLIRPLITGIPMINCMNGSDRYISALRLKNFALVPVVNKKRMACWDIKKCQAADCPAYGKKWLRCWLVAGTKCSSGGDVTIVEKSAMCARCPIYRDLNLETVEGVLIADNSVSDRPITDDVITALAIIAHTVGIAINNSKMYRRTLDEAIRDDLTDLHNRRYFNERMLDEVERSRRYGGLLSLILCDIDHFKGVNDTYGHPAGDSVLRQVAEILRKTLRKSDVISRYGGEEFAALLLSTDKGQALSIAEKLRGSVEKQQFAHNSSAINVTLSFGVATFGADSNSYEGLVTSADNALYRAKAQGRNRVCSL